jgi:hypothetical protein
MLKDMHLKTTTTMPSSKQMNPTGTPPNWTGSLSQMVADGRLAYVNTVNGKKLYALDRKKLGME